MRNLQIRDWKISDLKKIENLKKGLNLILPVSSKEFFSNIYRGKVALIDGKIVGFVLYWIVEDEVEIHAIIVSENYRRRSIGTALMTSIIEELKRIGKPFTIFLEVSEKNFPAINLYKKFGFKKVAERKKYYRNGDNALVLMLKINPTEVQDVQGRKLKETGKGEVPPLCNP
ncbi:ribosomal protein S18-alanine N-acetyltransferase [Desulfurobacterium sp. TC5-1]|uniref:ribosomal protein S18-alanine N-acetyltransferase n=1 Tax=Desulfurobacterium sp. TC5-1 TaxID=1158318 RepID=UPI0003B468E2|nr:ribosomal protein S18-alanine N-acetyltransferase [Desulfurobacterium sp. TC5-1]